MIGKGAKATTDTGETVGLALSGAFFSTCDFVRVPEAPRPPCADFRDDIDAGISVKGSTWPAIFAAARRSGSERARVLLENYSHRLR